MLLNYFWALVDGAGYGAGDTSASSRGPGGPFPQGVLTSFPWEGWWQEDPDMVPQSGTLRALPHGTAGANQRAALREQNPASPVCPTVTSALYKNR